MKGQWDPIMLGMGTVWGHTYTGSEYLAAVLLSRPVLGLTSVLPILYLNGSLEEKLHPNTERCPYKSSDAAWQV